MISIKIYSELDKKWLHSNEVRKLLEAVLLPIDFSVTVGEEPSPETGKQAIKSLEEKEVHEYVVDFGSWYFEAKSEEEARQKAIVRIGDKKDFPPITNVERND